MERFWKAFLNQRNDADSVMRRLSLAANMRFWWGPLTERPPLPLGVDEGPRCYRRIIFGRELTRTGLGGFVTPRVLSFYHAYLGTAIAQAASHVQRRPARRSDCGEFCGIEYDVYEQMHPGYRGSARDPFQLERLFIDHNVDFFNYGEELLAKNPFRLLDCTDDVHGHVQLYRQNDTEAPAVRLNILILQRRKKARRWIANVEEVVQLILNLHHPRARLSVLLAHFEDLHPATQWRLAAQAHIFVGAAGAGLAWLAFMPPGSAVLDLFPPHARSCTEGWGGDLVSHYGGLSRLARVQHACSVHPADLQFLQNESGTNEQLALREIREKLGGFWHGLNIRVDLPKFRNDFEQAVVRVLLARFEHDLAV